jgi:hypothetical protein
MRTVLYAAAIAIAAQSAVTSIAFAADSAATSIARSGQMLYDSTGHRVASVNRVMQNGDVQVILNGRLVTIPASSLSQADGKLTTSLSKADIGKAS